MRQSRSHPRDVQWRRLAPGWTGALALARAGLPFHLVSDRRYDRSGDRRRLRPALDTGATAYLPQAHEVLPRVARLMVAIRAGLLGPLREECSFLFIVKGRGREGMGLHHDGRVDAFWVQLDGRRTVTLGPPVRPGTAEDLPNALADRGGPGWRTIDLTPGTLFYLPPFTPHRVLCHGRSLALSLTWSAPPRRTASARARAASLAAWPVASGRATPIPSASRDRLWTQVPAVLEPDASSTRLWTQAGHIRLPRSARELARQLAAMPSFPRTMLRGPHREAIGTLQAHGILDPHDLPQVIVPADPAVSGRLALPLRPRYVPVRTGDHHTTGRTHTWRPPLFSDSSASGSWASRCARTSRRSPARASWPSTRARRPLTPSPRTASSAPPRSPTSRRGPRSSSSVCPASPQVRAVCLGADGLIGRLDAGRTLVDMSTVPVALARELDAAARARGVDVRGCARGPDRPGRRGRHAVDHGGRRAGAVRAAPRPISRAWAARSRIAARWARARRSSS